MIGGSWFSLTLVSLDQVDLTAVADEHLDGEHVEQVPVRQVGQRKIKIRGSVYLSDHDAPVRLGSTVVHDIIARDSSNQAHLTCTLTKVPRTSKTRSYGRRSPMGFKTPQPRFNA